jgi:hypothetical protein
MNGWAIVIIVFAVALLPWQIFRYARRRNDTRVAKVTRESNSADDDKSDGFW